MKQLDLFYDSELSKNLMNWPNDFDGAHQIGGAQAGICRAAPDGVHILVDPPKTAKIYESPDKGKTVYERNFGETERRLIKTSVQQQWKITFNGETV